MLVTTTVISNKYFINVTLDHCLLVAMNKTED